ncbi:MAG: type II secretion system minor pseudopilin GspI [Magnetococcus sp. YQC-5]
MGVTPQGQRGFTLLEIMIAVALLGMLFVGIGAIVQRQMNTQFHLEEQLAAAQLASNLMEMFKVDGMPLLPDHLSGEEAMAGRLFAWTRQVRSTDDGKGYEVRIQVGPAAAPLFVERLHWSLR